MKTERYFYNGNIKLSIFIFIHVTFVLPNVMGADLVNLGGDNFEDKSSEIFIEPTPVLVRRTPRSTYRMGLPRKPPDQGGSWYEGSGRGRKPYNLEDFLVWMPSGDGPPEQWYYSKDYDWKHHYTKTVFVTSTKYETIVVPQYIAAAPHEPVPQIVSTDILQLGKDIQGGVKMEVVHECKVYHVLRPVYSSQPDLDKPQNDQSVSSNVDNVYNSDKDVDNVNVDSRNKFNSSKDNVQKETETVDRPQELGPDLKPSSSDDIPVTSILESSKASYDASDLVHSSIEYLGPSSVVMETPYTNFITPTLKSINEKTSLGISVFISSYYDMRSYNIDSTNIHYSFSTATPPVNFLTSFYSFTYTNDVSVHPTVSLDTTYHTPMQSLDLDFTKTPKFLTTKEIELSTEFSSTIFSGLNESFFGGQTDTFFFPNDSITFATETSLENTNMFISTSSYPYHSHEANKTIPVTISSYINETLATSFEYSFTDLGKTIPVRTMEDSSIFPELDENDLSTSTVDKTLMYSTTDSVKDTTFFTIDTKFSSKTTIPSTVPTSLFQYPSTTTLDPDSSYDETTTTVRPFHDLVTSITKYETVTTDISRNDQDSISTTPSGLRNETTISSIDKIQSTQDLLPKTTIQTIMEFPEDFTSTSYPITSSSYPITPVESITIISDISSNVTRNDSDSFITKPTHYITSPSTLDRESTTLKQDEVTKFTVEDYTYAKSIDTSFFDVFNITTIHPTDSHSSVEHETPKTSTPSSITLSMIHIDASTDMISASDSHDSTDSFSTSTDSRTSTMSIVHTHTEVPCKCDGLNATIKTDNITITKISNEFGTTIDPEIPQVHPSPSNNITAPVDQKYWIRTILYGPPDEDNEIFKSKMEGKLTKFYERAYKRQRGNMDNDNTHNTSSKKQAEKQETQQRNKRDVSLFHHYKYLRDKFNIKSVRSKRQADPHIEVRMQNVSYYNTTNITELIYSVFEDDTPILAIKAVTVMDNINYTEAEELLGYPLQVKAEEYLQPSWREANNKAYLIQLFALLAGISGLVVLATFFGCFIYKRYKRRATFESSRDLRDGSQASSPRGQVDAGTGTENLGFHDSHDEESTPEEGNSARISPDVENEDPYVRPSSSKRSSTSSKRIGSEGEQSPYSARGGKDYTTVEIEKKRSDPRKHLLDEPLYSTPKSIPLSQRQSNIELALQHARFKLAPNLKVAPYGTQDFIPGTSLPKFLPPPKTHFPLLPSPEKPKLPKRNYSLDESMWPKPEEENMEILPSQVEESVKEGSLPTMSRASSDVEISTETTSGGGIGLGRLRRRFHDLLDDAFSLMHGQRPTDKVTHISTPYLARRIRTRSAMPAERSNILDELEDQSQLSASAKPFSQHTRRPWSAAPTYYASEPISHHASGSLEVSPRSAWGDQRGCITPVNLPHPPSEGRPDSAPLGRTSSRSVRTPTPVDSETGLRVGDPALPLIQAIKEELHRFKTTVNNDSSDA